MSSEAAQRLRERIGSGLPPASLRQAFAEAREQGVREDTLIVAEHLNDLALREGQHMRFLNLLQHTVADLTRIRSTEEVLRAICERTRTLLGSDMAYISLNDDATERTFIAMTSGVRTEAYRNIRMPLGTGVLGVVATGDRTAQSIDYGSDEELTHLPAIDEAVAGEGVRTILGAPMRVAGQVIGALMLAERRQRVFSDEEISTIETIAAHAAVAVENARLFSELRQALVEAQRRRHNELIDDVMSGELESAALRRRLLAQGFTDRQHLAVAVIAVDDRSREAIVQALLAARRPGTIVASHARHVCVVMGVETGSDRPASGLLSSRDLIPLLPKDATWTIGASNTHPLESLRDAHHEAHSVAQGLLALGRQHDCADPAALGSAGLLAAHGGDAAVQSITQTLRPLIAHDETHTSDLVRTATVLLDENQQIARAAARLHVHQNTVRQRIARIEQIMGADWLQGSRAFDAHLALRLHLLQQSQ